MNKNELPKHAILSLWIKENIMNNIYSVGQKIPSENELAAQFSYSRQTVRQAISTLVAEGILVREQGSGTYVSITNKKPNKDKTMRVGVITTYLDDYIFPSIIHGMEDVLTHNDYTLSLGITYNKPANEENCLKQMIQSGVDGLIIEGTKSALPNINENIYHSLKEKNIPLVFINGYYSNFNDCYIVMDDVKACEMLMDILIKNGHTQIGGFFKSDDLQGLKRYEGFFKKAKASNIPLNDTSVIWYTTEDMNYLFDGNFDAILLERLKGVTAVICYNDQVAAAFIRLLKRNNLTVPEDISIVSFDNSFLAKQMVYNLTSMVYPSAKIGKMAAQLLLKRMNNPLLSEKIKLEPTVKIRDSVKNIKSLI